MKKNIPIAIRALIEEISDLGKNLCKAEFDENGVLLLKDSDIDSDYYFRIKAVKYDNSSGKTNYDIEYKPCSEEHLNPYITTQKIDGVKALFKTWKRLLEESNKPFSLFEDEITQSYYDEIEPNFEIVDEDASFKPFKIDQQKAIVIFLDKIKSIISEEAEQDSDLLETMSLIEESKKSISKSTKKIVIQRIRRIIAKCFKMGLDVGERLLIEFTTELSKKIILGSGR